MGQKRKHEFHNQASLLVLKTSAFQYKLIEQQVLPLIDTNGNTLNRAVVRPLRQVFLVGVSLSLSCEKSGPQCNIKARNGDPA